MNRGMAGGLSTVVCKSSPGLLCAAAAAAADWALNRAQHCTPIIPSRITNALSSLALLRSDKPFRCSHFFQQWWFELFFFCENRYKAIIALTTIIKYRLWPVVYMNQTKNKFRIHYNAVEWSKAVQIKAYDNWNNYQTRYQIIIKNKTKWM